jgi:hypothetical protein
MSTPASEPSLPPAAENAVRAYAHQLRVIDAEHGISELPFASVGRVVGHGSEDKDALDVADFELAAIQLLGADVRMHSDRVLRKPHVSPDLVTAQPV